MAKRVSGAMHVARVRKTIKGKTYESALLRQSYRQGQQVKHRTLASLTALPPHVVDAIEGMLKGESWVPVGDALIIQRSWPHGHAAAVLGSARRLELESLLDPEPSRQRDLVLAMIVARVLHPASKLATTRLLDTTSLGPALGVAEATEDELYAAMDWLLERQQSIEEGLARRYLTPGGGGAVRPYLDLCGGGSLPAGQARLQPGWEARETADRVWTANQRRGGTGGH